MYLARRYLKMGPHDWRNLPWWERRLYIEGFEAEGLVSTDGAVPVRPGGPDSPVAERRRQEGNTTVIERDYRAGPTEDGDEFAGLGATVIEV